MSKHQDNAKAKNSPAAAGKPSKAKAKFLMDFKEGPIVAKVWLCDGTEGTKFLKFSLPRYYQSHAGTWVDRKDYFGRNEENLIAAIKQASAFCNEHQNNPEQAIAAAEGLKSSEPVVASSQLAQNGLDSGDSTVA